ncbi:TetR/AcrR family transcriptional regulator [Streptomyces hoynatensis]|uniref:TetR/AcrR family transcriptional regulator n=1 Tax=Streptomyces hoynatensis TaxID=1141874 RepID=A0A3A9YWM9_9ACTN|nr:TetR/AcrR family transcriptional regulator [Streptomyces hoynatensis]RKN40443.1 TetR/AcrR family transcriptional regulator [Streptomyces hoynatensis]
MTEQPAPRAEGAAEAPGLSRAQRRLRSERRILEAARELFARQGFERTTIRAVAAAAGVDPALVMQHFGSKQGLFTQAVRVAVPESPAAQARDQEQVVDALLGSLGLKLDGLPASSLAMMRSMLTHPEAAAHAREVLEAQISGLAEATAGPEARARAALLMSITVGVAVCHQLLALDSLRGTPQDRLAALLRPALRALLDEDPG